jgi:hypothetical protein
MDAASDAERALEASTSEEAAAAEHETAREALVQMHDGDMCGPTVPSANNPAFMVTG